MSAMTDSLMAKVGADLLSTLENGGRLINTTLEQSIEGIKNIAPDVWKTLVFGTRVDGLTGLIWLIIPAVFFIASAWCNSVYKKLPDETRRSYDSFTEKETFGFLSKFFPFIGFLALIFVVCNINYMKIFVRNM